MQSEALRTRFQLFRGWWRDLLWDGDRKIELGMVGPGRNNLQILPLMVEDSEELDGRVGVGR